MKPQTATSHLFVMGGIIIFFLFLWLPCGYGSGINESCLPQSCGSFQNIRCPFTLKGANNPYKCSQPLELGCDRKNNRSSLSFGSKTFNVVDIDYGYDQRIRILDPGLQENDSSSMPRYSFSNEDVNNNGYSQYNEQLYYMNCSTRVDSPKYVDALPCINRSSSSSSSNNNTYTYIVWADTQIQDLKDSCKLWMTAGVSKYTRNDSFSCFDFHHKMLIGYNLNWEDFSPPKFYAPGSEVYRRGCIILRPAENMSILEEEEKTSGAWRKKTAIGVSILFFGFLVATLTIIRTCKQSDEDEKEKQLKIEKFLESYKDLTPKRYSYADIKRITNKFQRQLGEGGFGSVFEGRLTDGIPVAVKILNDSQSSGEDFINEVGTIGRIHHINVVRLLGFCADGFRRALIYEYMPNESLEKFIFSSGKDNTPFFGWEKLQGISIGIARGIEYLHQGCEQRILHFDIKPHNILLDHKFNPKISDFGLAKLCSKGESIVSMTAVRGTMGYIAPEVFSRTFGNVSYKSDVYSFGMLLLEMVGGRKNSELLVDNTNQVYFPEWIYSRLEQGEELGIAVETKEDANIARKLANAALWCIQWKPLDRPSMKSVIQMLEGNSENLIMPPNPFVSSTSSTTFTTIPEKPQQQTELIVIQEELE